MTQQEYEDDFRQSLIELVQQAVAHGVDLNTHPKFGGTFLDNAVASQYQDLIELLIASGIDVDAPSEWGSPALLTAYRHFYSDGIHLLRRAGASTDCIAPTPVSSLLLDAMEGACDSVTRLLDTGVDVDARGHLGRTALICAAGAGQLECVRLLLDRGAEVDAECESDFAPDKSLTPYGSNALVQATTHGYADVVELLLDQGANVEGVSGDMMSPLSYAAFERRDDVALLLLSRGASVKSKNTEKPYLDTPLAMAAWMGREELAKALLANGAGKDQRELQDAYRLCHFDNGLDVCPLLREAGMEIGLIEAVLDQDVKLVTKLLEQGADPNQADDYGKTPLMFASAHYSWFCNEAVIRLLLEHGAILDSQNSKGETARDLLMESGFEWMPELVRKFERS